MEKLTGYIVILLIALSQNLVFAVDKGSDAYSMGNIVGKLFVGIIIFLIIKRYIFKK